MAERPARLAGLEGRKGRIAEGYDGDLVVWDPQPTWAVEAHRLQQRHPLTPYAARRLRGIVEMTFLRGVSVYQRGSFPVEDAGAAVLTAGPR
jgi:allantoinase